MERIEGQVKDQEQLAKQVLSWITCAKRPLTVLELQHALAVEVGTLNLDEENLPDIGDIVSTCAGLVTVDEESNVIRLVHYTTQEYFERTWTSWFPNAQSDITVTCVTYLLFHTFETGFCFTDKEFERRLHTNVLYDYAARYWGHHARAASAATKQLILSFLESQAKLSASSQALMASKSYNGYSQRIPRLLTPLHIAAYFGLKDITIYLLENGYDPNLQDTHGQTPLSWAAWNGHEAVVKLLIGEHNIQADLKDSEHGQTPLSWATRNGHESVIKLLLESGKVDADSIDSGYGQTPLSWAARNGNVAFVKLLLNTRKVAVDSKDIEYGRTPLWWASRNGHEGIVKLLLETGKVDPDSKDNGYGRTPLWWAARNGHESIAKLLLKTSKVEINLKDSEFCQTPLSWAARNGHEAVVKILLKSSNNVEVDSKDNGYRQTPLSWAARNGHKGIVNLLLENNNVEADVKDKYSQTPLSWAAQNGHDAVIKLLLESGKVDINLKDTQYNRTPLSWAIRNKHEAVVELLLANGARSESSGEGLTTSIH
jgi:ankyrin repeat protein